MKTNINKEHHILHTPVLAREVLQVLEPKKGQTYLDLTGGYGGHASLVLKQTKNFKGAVLCDRDNEAINHLSDMFKKKVSTLHMDFFRAVEELSHQHAKFDLILADLGVSSPHLDKANRGFSVVREGPLDMRMDQSSGKTAAEVINTASEKELETILRVYGEEPKARKIARAIVESRPFESTTQLAETIKRAYGGYSKHHPAVRSFQAFRIAVNDELGLLTFMLPKALTLLNPGGRFAVITFHSLEDRIVKKFFAEEAGKGYESEITVLTKKPITPSAHEISFNPRARSSKLRAVLKK